MLLMERRVRTSKTVLRPTLWTRHGGAWICRNVTALTGLLSPQEMLIVSSNCLGTWALYYFSDLTLSVFLPMATQLSMKAELPLAKSLATVSFRSSHTGHRLHFIKSDLLDSMTNQRRFHCAQFLLGIIPFNVVKVQNCCLECSKCYVIWQAHRRYSGWGVGYPALWFSYLLQPPSIMALVRTSQYLKMVSIIWCWNGTRFFDKLFLFHNHPGASFDSKY